MSAHDTRLRQAINLALDLRGARGDLITVREIAAEVRIRYPFRSWHPTDQLAAEQFHLHRVIKSELQTTLSQDYIDRHLTHVPMKFRNLVGELTAWFYVIDLGRWVFSLNALPEHWDAGAQMRIDMAQRTLAMAAPFQEKAEMLRASGAKCLRDLLTRKAA